MTIHSATISTLLVAANLWLFAVSGAGYVSASSIAIQKQFIPEGYYVARGAHGRLSEFEHIWLSESGAGRNPSVKGAAYIKGVYVDLKGEIENRKLTLVTDAHGGFRYKFEGRFLRTTRIFESEKPVLKGVLSKYRDGRKVAAMIVEFVSGVGRNS